MTKLADIKKQWEEFIILKDDKALDVIIGTVIANQLLDRDPVWTLIIGNSSGGKSTLLAPLVDIASTHFIDDVTEKTFLSGYKIKGKNASLLTVIGSGMMIFSDFTSILAKNIQSRGEILSQFRLIYDRKLSKHTGTGGVSWAGKIGVLAGATAEIYYHLESGRAMGERFIYYYLEQPTDNEIAQKQATTNISAEAMTNIMKLSYADYYDGVREWIERHGEPQLKVTEDQRRRIRQASIFCVNGKATVHTNFKTGKADQIPNKAGVGRDLKQYEALLLAFQVMWCYESNDVNAVVQDWMIDLVDKCSYSSINRERRKVLEILTEAGKPLSASEIGSRKGFGLDKDAVQTYLIPLHAVGLISKQVKSSSFKWFIDDEDTIDFINKIKGSVQEIPLKAEDKDDIDVPVDDEGTEDIQADWDSIK